MGYGRHRPGGGNRIRNAAFDWREIWGLSNNAQMEEIGLGTQRSIGGRYHCLENIVQVEEIGLGRAFDWTNGGVWKTTPRQRNRNTDAVFKDWIAHVS